MAAADFQRAVIGGPHGIEVVLLNCAKRILWSLSTSQILRRGFRPTLFAEAQRGS
jgi:hypothetical protein